MWKVITVCVLAGALCALGCESELLPDPSVTLGTDAGTGTGESLGDATGDGSATDDALAGNDAQPGDDAQATDVSLEDALTTDDATIANDGTVSLDATDPGDTAIGTDVAVTDASVGVDGQSADTQISLDMGPILDAPAILCGNGYCDAGENPQSCPNDCKGFSWVCGDGVCDVGEQFYCSNDCSASACGNGKCEPGEGTANCPGDCPASAAVCGNGQCESGENGTNCSKDCGIGTWQCGDGKCDFGEQFYCQKDCSNTQVDPVQCTQQKCLLDYQKCAKSAPCLQAFQCIVNCGGKWGCQQGCVQSAGNGGNDAVQLSLCGQQAGCL